MTVIDMEERSTDWDKLATTVDGISTHSRGAWYQEFEIAQKYLRDVPGICLGIIYTASGHFWTVRVAIHGGGVVDKRYLYLSDVCNDLIEYGIAENLKAILLSMCIELEEEEL